MELPKPIYENLPYLYFLMSGGLLVVGESLPIICSSAIFYFAGCIVLVTRSSFRRKDKANRRKTSTLFPEVVYEYLPYCYIASGIFLLMATDHRGYQFTAFCVLVWGVRNITCRHHNRLR